MADRPVVNDPRPRVDGRAKVRGRAQYTDDIRVPGMLHGGVLLSPLGHGTVALDVTAASRRDGVACLITAADLPDPSVTWLKQPVLAGGTVRFAGEALALVAAVSPGAAAAAVRSVGVRARPLPCREEPAKTAQKGTAFFGDRDDDRIEDSHWGVRKGEAAAGLASSEVVLSARRRTQCVEHMYLETERALVVPQDEGRLLIQASVQHPYLAGEAVASVLGIPQQKVRVVQPTVGGSFGGKLESGSLVCIWAALLAQRTGRPVSLVLDREQSVRISAKRHPFRMEYTVGATAGGVLQVLQARIQSDGGGYGFETPFVNWRAAVHAAGCYQIPHVDVSIDGYYSHRSRSGAFRGFGSPQVIFGQETLMDQLAAHLGLSPLEIRRRNVLEKGATTATGHRLDTQSVPIRALMETMAERTGFEARRALFEEENERARRGGSPGRRGIGIAISFRGCGFGAESPDATGAMLSMRPDGSISLRTGLTEMGQGLATAHAQIAAETLGVGLEQVQVETVDTAMMPDGGLTVASRGTFTGGRAVWMAARDLREKLLTVAATSLEIPADDLDLRDGVVISRSDRTRRMGSGEVAEKAYWSGQPLVGYAWLNRFLDGSTDWDRDAGSGRAYPTYTYACVISEVSLDVRTGRVRVERVHAGHDVGRAINPALARGQVYGGIAMGMGMALMEELHHREGIPQNDNLDRYRIPTAEDQAPELDVTLFESDDPFGPFHAKSLGEAACEAVPASIANAVSQAASVWVDSLPVTPEKLCGWMEQTGEEHG